MSTKIKQKILNELSRRCTAHYEMLEKLVPIPERTKHMGAFEGYRSLYCWIRDNISDDSMPIEKNKILILTLPETIGGICEKIQTEAQGREIKGLVRREMYILQKRASMTLEQLSSELNINKERVRQIEQKALRKLRQYLSGGSIVRLHLFLDYMTKTNLMHWYDEKNDHIFDSKSMKENLKNESQGL